MSKDIPTADAIPATTTVETVEVIAPATLQAGTLITSRTSNAMKNLEAFDSLQVTLLMLFLKERLSL